MVTNQEKNCKDYKRFKNQKTLTGEPLKRETLLDQFKIKVVVEAAGLFLSLKWQILLSLYNMVKKLKKHFQSNI